jgi:tetratricopeptide (TPR) repeat protein
MRSFLQTVDSANLDGELRTHQYAARVLPELDNLRAAHGWATGEAHDVETAIALAAHAGSLIDYAFECADWLLPLRAEVEAGAAGAETEARYWRALAASNMLNRLPRIRQREAGERAKSLYAKLRQPRRVFSCLIQIARHNNALHRFDEARAARDEARLLLRPDWPPEFRIILLRQEAQSALNTGQLAEAVSLYEEGVRLSAATGDWRLEVIARSNLANVYWTAGPLERAADTICALADAMRSRPAADVDMATLYANVLGILSESGRVDEASRAAPDALPVMRRAGNLYPESWCDFFYRRGQLDAAATLLGVIDAEMARTGVPLQVNEQRLAVEARAGLQARLAPDAFARRHAAGALLGEKEILALIAESIERPVRAS